MKKITKRNVYSFLLLILLAIIIETFGDWKNAVKGAKDGWNENHPSAEK